MCMQYCLSGCCMCVYVVPTAQWCLLSLRNWLYPKNVVLGEGASQCSVLACAIFWLHSGLQIPHTD